MKQVSQEYFNKLYPELERIYNHSHQTIKLWQGTVRKAYVVEDIESKINQYWKDGYISP